MKATLEDVLGGEVEIAASKITVITPARNYDFEHPDDVVSLLWSKLGVTDDFGQAFNKVWPASCDWIVEWAESAPGHNLGEERK